MFGKLLLKTDYEICGEKNSNYLKKIFDPLPPLRELVLPFNKKECPLTPLKEPVKIPTDMWNLTGKRFTTLSCYQTALKNPSQEGIVLKKRNESQPPLLIKSLNCIELGKINPMPLGMLIGSHYDPATNYQRYCNILHQIKSDEEYWKEMKQTLYKKNDRAVFYGWVKENWEDKNINKKREYSKIGVRPVSTWVLKEGVAPRLNALNENSSRDDMIEQITEDPFYFTRLIQATRELKLKMKTPNNYVIETCLIKNPLENPEKLKYAILVEENKRSSYENAGLILKMGKEETPEQPQYPIYEVLNVVKKEIKEFRKPGKIKTWSNQLCEKIEDIETKSIPYTKIYN